MSFLAKVLASIEGGKTAMARKGPSTPLLWLLKHKLVPEGSSVLDYGCGRGADVRHLESLGYKVAGYDPEHRPVPIDGKFDVIYCIYVLNVRDEAEEKNIIAKMKQHLNPGGHIYTAVRRDYGKEGMQGKGCWQRWVECPEGFTSIKGVNGDFEFFKY